MKQGLFFFILLFFSTLFANELKIEQIFLEGSILNPKEEISGMDWYKEHLFLLPENQNNYLYVIPKREIYKSLNSSNKIKILPAEVKGPKLGVPENVVKNFAKSKGSDVADLFEKKLEKGTFYFAKIKGKEIIIFLKLMIMIDLVMILM